MTIALEREAEETAGKGMLTMIEIGRFGHVTDLEEKEDDGD